MKVEKILEGARCCFIEHDCKTCPYYGGIMSSDNCTDKIGRDMLYLISDLMEKNRLLDEENDQLNSENEWLRAYLNQPYKLRQALELYMESQNPQKESKE